MDFTKNYYQNVMQVWENIVYDMSLDLKNGYFKISTIDPDLNDNNYYDIEFLRVKNLKIKYNDKPGWDYAGISYARLNNINGSCFFNILLWDENEILIECEDFIISPIQA